MQIKATKAATTTTINKKFPANQLTNSGPSKGIVELIIDKNFIVS